MEKDEAEQVSTTRRAMGKPPAGGTRRRAVSGPAPCPALV